MENNQNQQSQHLSRDEFEKYIDRLSTDEVIDIMPRKIGKYDLTLSEDSNGEFLDLINTDVGTGIFYYSYCGYRCGQNICDGHVLFEKELPRIENETLIEQCKKLAMVLYDNGHLPQYSGKLDS